MEKQTNTDYDQFVAAKIRRHLPHGFEPREITAPLFDWQKHVVRWAVRQGRAALFEDCGLGKTLQQLEWADQVAHHTGKPVLVLTPLAVAHQTKHEAERFGYVGVSVAEKQADVTRITITNYEKLEHFTPSEFAGVVLDESSILKNFTGKTRQRLTAAFAETPYRLCCTATPSPNDYTEFGQHADFLGVCSPAQMLCTFFINDTFNTGDWRLKRHAEHEFWRWVASWAACISKPSDIGFSDAGYILPALRMHQITVEVDETAEKPDDELFRVATLSATTMHKEMRLTSRSRAQRVAELVQEKPDEHWLIWCNTNDEADLLASMIPHAVEVRGTHTSDKKEAASDWFMGFNLTQKQVALLGLAPKLAACGNQNTPKIDGKNTPKKNKSAVAENASQDHQKKIRDTCENITSQTNTDINEPNNNKKWSTNSVASDMPLTTSSETLCLQGPKSILHKTQELKNPQGSKNTDSNCPNLTPCLRSNLGNAQYADTPTSLAKTISRSLTIATQRKESEDCCACLATKGSESSETTQNGLGAQRNTSKGRVLISKPSIYGSGLNFQHCANVAFVGLSYSFEDFYQALRRSYRFGQKREVNAYIVQAATEGAILKAVEQKIAAHANMQVAMKEAAEYLKQSTAQKNSISMKTDITTAHGADWTMHHGDCVRVARSLPDNSIDLAVFSPPFADLFTYSSDVQDMGNCADLAEFTKHFELLIAELARIVVPGREVAVHCVDLLSTKWKHGKIEFQDFSGEIIRAFWRQGFLFHSRICIWKSPVTEMQRTKAHGLLYKTLKADSCDSRVGCADYLLIFRKPGENPKPVTKDPASFPVDLWQEYASPVWMTVDQGNVLNRDGARDDADERHICPLQLDVIERAVNLWSNPGDVVFSPFAGIGSEGYQSVKMGRKFIGSELKESYFKQACANLKNAGSQMELLTN